MIFFYFSLLFIFGLLFGSFFNVLIFRYNPDHNMFAVRRIGGRSHCPHCKKTLTWGELIPLFSFIVQRGKCRACHGHISWQYPFVEAITGALFAGIPFALNGFYGVSHAAFFALALPFWYYLIVASWVLVFSVFLLMTAVDFKWFIIPNELTLALLGLGGILTACASYLTANLIEPFRTSFLEQYILVFPSFGNAMVAHFAGAIIGFLFFLGLSLVTRGRGIGFGDVKLAFALGLVFGWPDIVLITLLAFVIGGVWSGFLMLLGVRKMKDRVPFAPLFVLGAITTFFWGGALLKGYFSVFGL